MKTKTTICTSSVPACLSPTGAVIEKGTKVEYTNLKFFNGEHYIVFANGRRVPSIFFDC
jgi:hypothetical protein